MSTIVKIPFLTNNYDKCSNRELVDDVFSDEFRYNNIKSGDKIYTVTDYCSDMPPNNFMKYISDIMNNSILMSCIYDTEYKNFKQAATVKNFIPVLELLEVEIKDTDNGNRILKLLEGNKLFISGLYKKDEGNIYIDRLVLSLGYINGHIMFI